MCVVCAFVVCMSFISKTATHCMAADHGKANLHTHTHTHTAVPIMSI